jgi:hypothetical protein
MRARTVGAPGTGGTGRAIRKRVARGCTSRWLCPGLSWAPGRANRILALRCCSAHESCCHVRGSCAAQREAVRHTRRTAGPCPQTPIAVRQRSAPPLICRRDRAVARAARRALAACPADQASAAHQGSRGAYRYERVVVAWLLQGSDATCCRARHAGRAPPDRKLAFEARPSDASRWTRVPWPSRLHASHASAHGQRTQKQRIDLCRADHERMNPGVNRRAAGGTRRR